MALGCIMAVWLMNCHADEKAASPGCDASTPVQWGLLHQQEKLGRSLVKLRIVMFQYRREGVGPMLDPYAYVRRENRCEVETADPVLLSALPEFLSWSVRSTSPRTPENDEPVGELVGELHLVTREGGFMIGISNMGFTVNSRRPTWGNQFESWGVAKIIDDALIAAGEPGLHPRFIQRLSPLGRVELEKRVLERLRGQPSTSGSQ
jgi:hypothetical protein